MWNNYLRAAAVSAITLAVAVPLLAPDVLGQVQPTFSARVFNSQQTHYCRKTVNFNDPFQGPGGTVATRTGAKMCRLPQNAYIRSVMAHVTTAFDGTTPVLALGADVSPFTVNNRITASVGDRQAGFDATTATPQNLLFAQGLGVKVTSAGDVDLYVAFGVTSGTPTAGVATVVVEYVPNNDL